METDIRVVYDLFNGKEEVFRGTLDQCQKWIYNHVNDGFFRTWEDETGIYYDVNPTVYIIKK